MDGVQRFSVLSFTARMRYALRGREASEERASLSLFIFLAFAAAFFAAPAKAEMNSNNNTFTPPPPVVIDRNSPLYKAAKDMEADFMRKMLRNMRKSVPESPELEASRGYTVFREMLDDHYADTAARTQGIGLADLIVKQEMERQQSMQIMRQQMAAQVRALNKSDVIRK